MSARGKILVIRGGAIGDFILTLPALSALRLQFPKVHLEVLGYPHVADLAVAGKIVDRVRSIESRPLANFFARGGELSSELCEYFSTFDIIISYLYDPDKIFQTNIARCSMSQFIVGPHRPNEKLKIHATKVFLQPLERLAIFDVDPVPKLFLNAQPKIFNQLALHPGSGSEKKNWPQAKWVELIKRILDETDRDILLIGGEAEGAWMGKLFTELPPRRCAFAENLPLVDLAARLENCTAFIGHDSGISHLAAALDLHGIILWGDTVKEIWASNNPKTKIVRNENGLTSISVPEVFDTLNNLKLGETFV